MPKARLISQEEKREAQILSAINQIEKVCQESKISLLPKELENKTIIIVKDSTNGNEYGILK